MTKEQKREYHKKWYWANHAREKEKRRAWRIANKEKMDAYRKKYNEQHPEVGKAAKRSWRERFGKEYMKQYHAAHGEKIRKRSADWYEKHRNDPETIKKRKEYAAIYQKKQAAKRNASWDRRYSVMVSRMDGTAEQFITRIRLSPKVKCYYCGKAMPGDKMHIDHVIAISRNGNHSSSNLCASCPKCNLSKASKLPSEWKRTDQIFLNL